MKNVLRAAFITLAIGAIVSVFSTSGCASSASPVGDAPTMAVAISTPDRPPSAEQLATINQLLQAQIARRGFRVAKNGASADYVMRVHFIPDPLNPRGGHLTFIGIERNQNQIALANANAATEASASALAELRKVISETEWLNAGPK
jgi:hypothetical protein